MPKQDPFLLDPDEAQKQEKEVKGSSSGIICKKRHGLGECKFCNFVAKLYRNGDKESEEKARQISAKARYYLNAVFPEEPNKVVLMEIGKKAGDRILYGIGHEKWVDIAHPKKGKGRELMITKTKGDGGFNEYVVSPSLQNADWDIPKEVLENLYNLDNILEIVEDEDVEIFSISSLKMDESLTFRVCPPWNYKEGGKRIMVPVWRHWNTHLMNEEQEDGEVDLPWMDDDEASKSEVGAESEGEMEVEAPKGKTKSKKPACFGDEDCFEEDDEQCQECDFFKKCKVAVEG